MGIIPKEKLSFYTLKSFENRVLILSPIFCHMSRCVILREFDQCWSMSLVTVVPLLVATLNRGHPL